MDKAQYRLVIVGGGPAGLSAGLYAARGRMQALLIEKGAAGGQALSTDWIDNYPGFVDGVSGFDLMGKMEAHAERFGLEKKSGVITAMELQGRVKRIVLESGEEISADTVILCTGARPKKLGIPGEQELGGRGVSYCATCDGPFYRNLEIAVVGGGNTAIQEALHLTRFADKVHIIHRRDSLRAAKILQEKAFSNPKIDFIWNTRVQRIQGGQSGVESLLLLSETGEERSLPVSGIFIFIGIQPNNEILPLDILKTDADGFLLTDAETATSLPGVFAAGDICSKSFRQIVNAAGEGAVAALAAERYLELELDSAHDDT